MYRDYRGIIFPYSLLRTSKYMVVTTIYLLVLSREYGNNNTTTWGQASAPELRHPCSNPSQHSVEDIGLDGRKRLGSDRHLPSSYVGYLASEPAGDT